MKKFLKGLDNSWHKCPLNNWGTVAAGAYFVGAAVSTVWVILSIDRGANEEALIALLVVFIVIGIFAVGIGQVVQTAAHGSISTGAKRIDGYGKVVGLFGWSLGLVGSVFFAMRGTEAPGWLIALALGVVVAVSAATTIVSAVLTSRHKQLQKPLPLETNREGKHRMSNLTQLLTDAKKTGAWAAKLETAVKNRGTDDHLHHLGDDTGDLITQAYRSHGADAAAEVIEVYLASFNSGRAKASVRPVSPAEAIANLGWAIKPQGITSDEQSEVRSAFNERNGIA